MYNHQFDEFFRNKLQDYSSLLPENMWQRIQAKKEKDRKGFFIWNWPLFGGLLLIGSLSLIYLILKTTKNRDNRINNLAVKRLSSDKENISQENTKNHLYTGTAFTKPEIGSGSQRNKKSSSRLQPDVNDNAGIPKRIAGKMKKDLELDYPHGLTAKIVLDSVNINLAPKQVSLQGDPLIKKRSDTVPDQTKELVPPLIFKKENWSLELYGSPDLPFNNFKPVDPYSHLFQPGLSYTIGLRLGKMFGRHFSARIGIQYSQINEFISFDSAHEKWHVFYKNLDAPLLIGYKLNGEHTRLTISAGLIFNIYSWYKEQFYFSNPGDVYKKYTGLSGYLGLHFEKSVNEKLVLFTEPYFRYPFSNMVNSDQNFTEKIDVLGLSLGMKYNLRKSRKHD